MMTFEEHYFGDMTEEEKETGRKFSEYFAAKAAWEAAKKQSQFEIEGLKNRIKVDKDIKKNGPY